MSKNLDEHVFQFLLSEYNSLRKEIENTTTQMRHMVTYALLASGGFWTWHTSRPEEGSTNLILSLVPAIISLLFFLYNVSLSKDLKRAGDYLSTVEASLALPDNLGWESHIRKNGWSGFADCWDYLFWPMVILGNVLGAFLL